MKTYLKMSRTVTKALKLINLCALMTLFVSFANAGDLKEPFVSMGDSDGGGANDIEAMFMQAKNQMYAVVSQKNSAVEFEEDLTAEILSLAFEFDHKTEAPFMHSNGSQSWIQTQPYPMAPLQVRTKAMKNMIGKIDLLKAINYIAHEIGHHLYGLDEAKAWKVASSFSSAYLKSIKTPALLSIKDGDYVGLNGACLDTAHIESDPATGRFAIHVNTTDERLCYKETTGVSGYVIDATFICNEQKQYTICKTVDELTTNRVDATATVFPDGGISVRWRLNNAFLGFMSTKDKFNQKYVPVTIEQ